jgi:mannose-1-phosphate guanylyltransferase
VIAVVLVGGEGTRLRPLTLTTPKQMLPVGGTPMIERVIGALAAHGVDRAVLSLGYRPDAFIEAYPDGTCAGVELRYAVEPEPLDTAGAIRFAALEAGLDSTFVVVNGDVLTDLDVTALIEFHRSVGAEGTVALTPVEDPSRFGVVATDGDGRVLDFVEKPAAGEAPTNLINAGTYVLEPSVIASILGGRRVSIERETFPSMVAEGTLFAMASSADWVDAGTPATYLTANLRYAEDPSAGAIAEGAIVKDSVFGKGVTVGEGAVVRDSLLLDGAAVGARAEVRCSIVGKGATIGDGASLDEMTVVGDGVEVPAGSVLSGQRIPPS